MFAFVRNLAMAAVAAVTLGLSGGTAQAVTLINDGDVVTIDYGDEFAGTVVGNGGAGSFTVQFDAVNEPIFAEALATIGNIVAGTFEGLTMSWVAVSDSFVLASTAITPTSTSLATVFTTDGVLGGNDISQWLIISWDDSQAGFGFDVEVAAAIPLPAGGLLLLGGLGALAAFRRKRAAA
jgi:hypothetical protein